MSGSIYLIQGDDRLVEMNEEPYDSEARLQELLARYPNLLAGDQMDGGEPRRWLLIRRESAIPSQEDGAGRWSVDHLFLDQDAVPTLVEVKRSTDTRLRREVVGQMLDYAANAVVYCPVEAIRAQFEQNCQGESLDSEECLRQLLGVDADAEQFWERARTNLEAGKIRMVFVADHIPVELRRVVEFLNAQMSPAEVLAVEIRQYVGQNLRTLVPRVMGQTARKLPTKSEGRQWDESTFFVDIASRQDEDAVAAARRILDWARVKGLRIWWGKGKSDGSFVPVLDFQGKGHQFISVWTYGRIEVQFQWLKYKPPFDDQEKRLELLGRVNEIAGIYLPDTSITARPSFPLSALRTSEAQSQFLAVLDWVVEELRSAAPIAPAALAMDCDGDSA